MYQLLAEIADASFNLDSEFIMLLLLLLTLAGFIVVADTLVRLEVLVVAAFDDVAITLVIASLPMEEVTEMSWREMDDMESILLPAVDDISSPTEEPGNTPLTIVLIEEVWMPLKVPISVTARGMFGFSLFDAGGWICDTVHELLLLPPTDLGIRGDALKAVPRNILFTSKPSNDFTLKFGGIMKNKGAAVDFFYQICTVASTPSLGASTIYVFFKILFE